MIKKIAVELTVRNIQPLDYGLNRISETIQSESKWGTFGRHSIQIFSYLTHPIDIGIQAIAYPLLKFSNPFISVGIDLANKRFTRAAIDTAFIPLKLVIAVFGTAFFELDQLGRLVWSMSGVNTAMNVYYGKHQSWNFFKMRRERDELAAESGEIAARMAPYIPIYNHAGTQTAAEKLQAVQQAQQALNANSSGFPD